jgi:hypothetical protein
MQQTLANPINQSDDIYKATIDIFDTIEFQHSGRLLGVRLTNLQHQVTQLPLFPLNTDKHI